MSINNVGTPFSDLDRALLNILVAEFQEYKLRVTSERTNNIDQFSYRFHDL